MALNFLNSVNLNQNELIKARIENQINNAAAGPGVEGQLFYDTTADVLKVWANSAWVEVGGGVISLTTANSTFVSLVDSGTAANPILTASLSAANTPDATRYLRGDNAWEPISAIPGTYNFIFTGDAGTSTTIASGATAKISGGTYISTSSANTGIVTITHDNTTRADATSTASPAFGSSFSAIDSVTTNATGHVTAVNLKTVTLPTTAVTQATGDNSTKIATTAFVQAAVTGLLEFKGGFNASTGAIASPGTGDLYTDVAVSVGDYYVVTVAGNFFGNTATPLTPGDSVIVQTAAAAGSVVEADFIVIQSDTDLATISTVGLGNVNAGTGVGVAYSNGTATVTNTDLGSSQNIFKRVDAINGIISELSIFANSNNDKLTFVAGTDIQILTDPFNDKITINSTYVAPATSYATTITDTATITHGFTTRDVIVQLYDAVTFETVYADVDRISSTQVTITFSVTPPNSIRVLVQK